MIFEYSHKNPSAPVAYASTEVMHTVAEIILPYMPPAPAREFIEGLWSEFERIEQLFSRYATTGPLREVNRTAGTAPVPVVEELYMALEMCRVFNRSTFGCFDITAHSGSRTSPKGSGNYLLDPGAKTVQFTAEGVTLDFGGYAKGYALEKAAQRLKQANLSTALLHLGSSSVLAVGTHPFGDYWPIAVEHPYFPGKVLHTVALRNQALSLSGCDRKGNAHIVDPSTGNTIARKEIIAVSGASAIVCEVLSTALYVAQTVDRAALLKQFEGYTATEIHYHTDASAVVKEIKE